MIFRLVSTLLVFSSYWISPAAEAADYVVRGEPSSLRLIQCRSSCPGEHPYSGPTLGPGSISLHDSLADADLSSADLRVSHFHNFDLTGISLVDADLSGAHMHEVSLRFAAVRDATLRGLTLDAADLTGADLRGVDWSDGRLVNVNLAAVDFRGARLDRIPDLGLTLGRPIFDHTTSFEGASSGDLSGPGFDPYAAGWTFVPEPSPILLVGLGLGHLARRRPEGHSLDHQQPERYR